MESSAATSLARHEQGLLFPAIGGLVVILVIANAVFLAAPEPLLVTWVNYAFMAATPSQIVIALLLKCDPVSGWQRLPQPGRGLRLLALNLLAAAIVAPLWMLVTSGRLGTPGPQFTLLTIVSVVATLWIVPLWHGWPVAGMFRTNLARGAAVLVLCYALAYLMFRLLFNFDFLKGAPVYDLALDGGAFPAFWMLSFLVTTVGVILAWVLFEFWPLGKLAQPLRGFVLTTIVLTVSAALFSVGTVVLEVEPMRFLVTGPVCLIFGIFAVNNLCQHRLFEERTQPLRGVLLLVGAILVSSLAFLFYRALAALYVSATTAAPPFQFEIWMATAILGVTFPIFVMVTEYFELWPFVRRGDDDRQIG
jgi:hypothetical protein